MTMYLKRLQREHRELLKEQPPFIEAHPDPHDILEWHFAVIAPPDSPFEAGIYWGQITFPPQYPMAPPAIKMMTPSGRFVPNMNICFSMSNFHPEQWQPSWGVRSICIGFLSFMLSDEITTGGVSSADAEKRALAAQSIGFNAGQTTFRRIFPHLINGIPPKVDPPAEAASSSSSTASTKVSDDNSAPAPAVAVAAAPEAVAIAPIVDDATIAPAIAAAAVVPQKAASEMSMKELKAELKALNVASDDCVEKSDLVAKLESVRAAGNTQPQQ
jgi:ubiquitin-conjugating enzyme E2 J2